MGRFEEALDRCKAADKRQREHDPMLNRFSVGHWCDGYGRREAREDLPALLDILEPMRRFLDALPEEVTGVYWNIPSGHLSEIRAAIRAFEAGPPGECSCEGEHADDCPLRQGGE